MSIFLILDLLSLSPAWVSLGQELAPIDPVPPWLCCRGAERRSFLGASVLRDGLITLRV